MADKKKSVADILAAARKADAKGGSADTPATEAAPNEAAAEAVPAAKPTAPAAKKPAGGGRPSVAEMMAMARGDKQGSAAPLAPKEKPAAKPAAPVAKAAPAKKEAAVAKAAPVDTQSILAA